MNRLTLQIPQDIVPEKCLAAYYQTTKSNACSLLCLFAAMVFALDLYTLIKMLILAGMSNTKVTYSLEVVLVVDVSLVICSTVAYCTLSKYKCYFGGMIAILGFVITIPSVEPLLARPELFDNPRLL